MVAFGLDMKLIKRLKIKEILEFDSIIDFKGSTFTRYKPENKINNHGYNRYRPQKF